MKEILSTRQPVDGEKIFRIIRRPPYFLLVDNVSLWGDPFDQRAKKRGPVAN